MRSVALPSRLVPSTSVILAILGLVFLAGDAPSRHRPSRLRATICGTSARTRTIAFIPMRHGCDRGAAVSTMGGAAGSAATATSLPGVTKAR